MKSFMIVQLFVLLMIVVYPIIQILSLFKQSLTKLHDKMKRIPLWAFCLLFGVSAALGLRILSRFLIPRFDGMKNKQLMILSAYLLPALFLPLYYITPDFPVSPLLREQADIALQFKLTDSSQALDFPSDDVRLVIGEDVFGLCSFKMESGAKLGDRCVMSAGGSEFFRWQGPVDSLVTLNITLPPADGTINVLWDRARSVYQLSKNAPTQIVMKQKFETPVALSVLLFIAEYNVLAYLCLILAVLLRNVLPQFEILLHNKRSTWLLVICAIALGVITVRLQVVDWVGGIDALNFEQLDRHMDVLRGTAPNPWQYRVLSEWVAEGFVRLFGFLAPHAAVVFGFLSFRLLQNILIFILALILYNRLGGSHILALLGSFLLASSMKNALFESDLSFNTYFDLFFYLLAVLFILERKYTWIIALTFFAALNRETSGLIPFLLLSAAWTDSALPRSRKILPAIASFGVWALVFIGLRVLYPDRPLYIAYHQMPGYPLLVYNLTRSITWTELFHTFGFIPVLGLFSFFAWHPYWKRFFFIMVPAWFVIHAFAGIMAETRLFLVPLAIVFIPSVLFLLRDKEDVWSSAQKVAVKKL
ncbi:MAG: hypothetical protein MUO77_08000, partial [Anaerolineales bacterium]|nr:hypothetical protein [Anaerolineales bacterium]